MLIIIVLVKVLKMQKINKTFVMTCAVAIKAFLGLIWTFRTSTQILLVITKLKKSQQTKLEKRIAI